jgi:hypothetical protein
MALNKKGDVSLQFNWIFIVIAGVVILGFFVGITMWQMGSNERQKQVMIINHLDTSLETIEQSVINAKDALHKISIPTSNLEMQCDESSSLRIKGTSYSISLATNAWFSKKEVSGDRLYVWTSSWNAPFQVMPFVYVDDGKTLFVFVNTTANAGSMELLYQNFLYNGSKVFLNVNALSEVKNFYQEGYTNYKFIFFNESIQGFNVNANTKMRSFSAVNIKPYAFENFDTVGIIEFYGQAWPFSAHEDKSFIKKESVYGAIFSENANTYDCTLKKGIGRLKKIAEIQSFKASNLSLERHSCRNPNDYYQWPKYYLDQLKIISYINPTNDKQVFEYVSKLDKANNDLAKVSCPVIY